MVVCGILLGVIIIIYHALLVTMTMKARAPKASKCCSSVILYYCTVYSVLAVQYSMIATVAAILCSYCTASNFTSTCSNTARTTATVLYGGLCVMRPRAGCCNREFEGVVFKNQIEYFTKYNSIKIIHFNEQQHKLCKL